MVKLTDWILAWLVKFSVHNTEYYELKIDF